MRKNVSAVLIVSFFFQIIGCYTMKEISKEELNQQVDKSTIKILTRKNKYTFEESAYSIIGRGKSEMRVKKSFEKKLVVGFDSKIALSEVLKIEAYKFIVVLTIIAVCVPLALIILGASNYIILGDKPLW